MDPVQLGPSGALAPSVAQEVVVAALVQVGRHQRRVKPADEPGRRQAVPEVAVGMVKGPEVHRAEAGAEAVGPPHGQVAGPQDVEDGPLPPQEAGHVAVVLGGVEAGADAARPTARHDHRHRPGNDQATAVPVVGGVAGDGAGGREDIVVEEHHHLAGRLADANLKGPQMADVADGHGADPGALPGQTFEHADGGGVGTVDDHHQLEGARVGQDHVDQGTEPLGPSEGGHDHRCPVHPGPGVPGPAAPVTFLAWGAVPGRTAELAGALGGRSRCFFPPGGRRPPVLVRWAVSAAVTVVDVVRHRPRWVVVTNPPLPAALVAWAVGRAVGARVALDSHPGGFGAQGDRVAARLQPVHRWLVRRSEFSIVAADTWRRRVESWGGRAVVVHEAPGDWELGPPGRHDRLRVLYVGRFADDEPWQAVVEAAAAVPRCDIRMTGEERRLGAGCRSWPGNVDLVGYLDPAAYRQAVLDADVVLCLTTEPGSVMRAACEAVWAGRPLVVSDWPVNRELFPHAVHVANRGSSVADGIRCADADFDRLAGAAPAARQEQWERWQRQLDDLLDHLSLPSPSARGRGSRSSTGGRVPCAG